MAHRAFRTCSIGFGRARQGTVVAAIGWVATWLLVCCSTASQAQTLDPNFAYTQLTLPASTNNAVEQADGKVVVSVIPQAYAQGTLVKGFIRVNTDGSLDQDFGSMWLSAGGAARSMRMLPTGDILLVGSSCAVVESLGGLDLYHQYGVVVLHPDGTLNRQFVVSAAGSNGIGTDAADVQPDGHILLGGSFTTVNGVAMSRLARLLPGGQLDPSFTLAPGASTAT